MRKFMILLTLFFTLILISVFTPVLNQNDNNYEVLYKVDSLVHADRLAAEHNLTIERINDSGITLFSSFEPIDDLLSQGFVKNEKSHVFSPPVIDGDGYIEDQYALNMIHMFDAWEHFNIANDVRVAIIDTGIDIYHEEFINRISPLSYNVLTGETGQTAVIDDHGHGTRVTGIIGALKDNNVGIAGVADFAELMIIKANQPGLNSFDDIDIIEAIYYAVDHGADIINISFGSYYANPLTYEALEYARDNDVIVVAAAGNNAEMVPFYPAAFDNTLAVGSVNENRILSNFSNYGAYIDMVAPGSNILTTDRYNKYTFANGTSLAAPYVSGLIAMLLADDRNLSPDEVLTQLTFTTTKIGERKFYGHGLINAHKALTESLVTLSLSTQYEPYNETLIYKQDDVIGSLPDFDSPDYTFHGWYYDAEYSEPVLDSDIIENNLTIYAHLVRDYITIDFSITKMSFSPVRLETYTSYSPVDIHLDGYTFEGWFLDENFTVPYEYEPLSSDITLYAKHVEIVYHEVNLWYLDTIMDSIKVQSGDPLPISEINIDYYDVNALFTDQDKSIEYLGESIEETLDLYLDLKPHVYKISFESEGRSINPVHIPYGMDYYLPQARKDDEFFVGWYFDSDFENRFLYGNLTNDITLYARFSEEVSLVTYYNDTKFIDTHLIAKGASIDVFEPERVGYTFEGWYYDQSFALPYRHEPINYNVVLYAKYDPIIVDVAFYDFDNETIVYKTQLNYGDTINHINAPHTPRHPHLIFTFNNWDSEEGPVYEDTEIYPDYTVSLKPNTLTLNPNVDTINTGDDWEDPGLTLESDSLTVHTEGHVDTMTPGQYLISYFVYYNDTLLTILDRNVTVIASKPIVEITLNSGHSTIYVGETYIEQGAVSSHGDIEIIHSVNTKQAGVYTVTYQVVYEGHYFQKTRIVHVVDNTRLSLSHFIPVKKEDDYEISFPS